jgi:hypothetical protein
MMRSSTMFFTERQPWEHGRYHLEGEAPDFRVRVERSWPTSDDREREADERTFSLEEFEQKFANTPALDAFRSLPEISGRRSNG